MPPPTPYACLALALMVGTLLVAGCLSAQEQASGDDITTSGLTYLTEQLPPYNYQENGTAQGISVELLEAITERMGRKISREQVRFVPWAEGYRAALAGNRTVLFSTARTPEREDSFKWAGPIVTHREVLFARYDREATIRGPADLKGYRIGVIAGDIATQRLLDLGVNRSQLVTEENVTAIIAKLENGEVDLWCYPENTGRYFAEQATGDYYAFAIAYELDALTVYYAFSRDVPDSTVRSFQQALDSLKQERDAAGISPYERILGRYIPAIGLAQLQYLTEEWAPFNYLENGTASGIAVEILEAAFHDMGVNRSRADIRVVPLSDGFRAAQNGSTVLFSIVRTPERESLYKWAGPFTTGTFVLYGPASRNITIASDADLQRYRIGAVEGTIENSLLAARGVDESTVAHGKTPDDLLRMLEGGAIDLWATGDLAGRNQMLKTANDPNAYEIVYTLSENDFYFIFSRDVPDTLVNAFRHALGAVRDRKDARGVSDYERIIYRYLGVGCARPSFSDEAVTALVNTTAEAIGRDAAETFRRINAGEAPYRDAANPALYVFVYDANATMVADGDNVRLVGSDYRGKTDVTGRPFHDEIVDGAQRNGTGWAEYVYMNPARPNLYYKTAYYRLVRGSDGNSYIVCSGTFKRCEG
ncbi:MAG: transporter substrate-binding domain-containing protein [Methanospirillum sp.]